MTELTAVEHALVVAVESGERLEPAAAPALRPRPPVRLPAASAVALLALTLLVAVGLFVGLAGGTAAEPGGGRCPAVDRVGLAVDTAVPLVKTGAEARCRLRTDTGAGQALAAAGWLLTLAGWGSATLVVAGYTGLIRRA